MSQVEQHRHRRHGDVPVGDPSGIVVRGVNRSFGDFVALEDINLEVRPGGLTALLGPSGGGKSTLLRIIAGLDYPDSGSVEIAGRDATFLPPQRRSVGFVFQHYAAFKHLKTARNVAFGLEIRRRPKAEIRDRVAELLQLVHLEQFAERLPSQLSGGQRQRMALARALAVQPEVLLLDEPFGALDAQVRKELRDWLRRLHDEVHVTTLFVTHDQEEALEVADEIVVINGGRIEQVGSPADLYDHPANAFVMSFLGPVTRLAGTLVRPHDLEVLTDERAGAVQATVTKLLRVGYEVRVETSTAGGETPWVQLTRAQVEELGLATGQTVWLRALVATPFAATEGAAAREAARGGDAAGSSDAHAGPDAAGDPLPTTTVRA
jgi:sulfate/thiosulfate transport system ATP-binding protein